MGRDEDHSGGEVVSKSSVASLARCDPKQLSLSPREGFILSLVDGHSSVDDLASMAGLAVDEVCAVVARLRQLGAVLLPGDDGARQGKARRGRRSTGSMRAVRDPPKAPTRAEPIAVTCVPRLARTRPARLDIDVTDAFLLAQIDGSTSVADLASIAGIDIDALRAVLSRLEEADVILLGGEPRERPPEARRGAAVSVDVFTPRRDPRPKASRRASTVPPRRPSTTPAPHATTAPPRRPSGASTPRASASSARRATPPPRAPASRAPAPRRPSARMRQAEPVDETCELEVTLQERVDILLAKLPTATHYDVLGVTRDADAKAVKRAYFGFVATLHPDRHFKKRLGPFKKKLDEVFVRATRAYEALKEEGSRAAYDRTLPPPALAKSQPVEAPRVSLPGSEPVGTSRARIRIRATTAGMPAVSGPVRVPSDAPERSPMSGTQPKRSGVPRADPFDVMRRFFEEKVDQEGRQRARVFAEAGELELAKGNVIAAATQFQLALDCCDTPEVRAAFEAVQGKAQARKVEIHMGRAVAAEQKEQWSDAAAEYAKAHAARQDGRIAERLANAIRLEGGDLRQAARLAEDAVQAEPDNAAFRITLGEVYLDAGLERRAEAEAKRALGLSPKDERAQSLVARLGKASRG